jgi:hypothetical protein
VVRIARGVWVVAGSIVVSIVVGDEPNTDFLLKLKGRLSSLIFICFTHVHYVYYIIIKCKEGVNPQSF